jgi:iron complex outermembrane recepter protein
MPRVGPCIRVLLFLLFPSSALVAQTGLLAGRVADSSGSALAHANVSVAGLSTQTGDDGRYTFAGVPAGTQLVRVRLIGYAAAERSVTVVIGTTTTVDFTLQAQPISIAGIDVVVGSRARHSAAEELAVPVDVFTSDDIARQGTSETSQILQQLTPSVNFPHQSVTDANDIVRPFTLRGLSPDHTLVLLNGWRRHQMAVVNTFAYGTGAGSSGVDMNAIPASAIERIEVLRDGAAAQYGSDAIAGVVNVVTREGKFAPFINAEAGRYAVDHYADDGNTGDVNGGVGLGVGRGSLALFGEVMNRQPTNRAWADTFEDAGTGLTDSIDAFGQVVVKNNPTAQPNHHWGDGLERDIMTMANFRLPLNASRTSELFAFGGYSRREGSGNGYRRCAVDCASFITGRNWSNIYPDGYLPEFHPNATDYSATGGYRTTVSGWSIELGADYGHSDFQYDLRNTLNVSLGPCLQTACSAAGIPNQTSFDAGRLTRNELTSGINVTRGLNIGLNSPANLAFGVAYRWEQWQIGRGDSASYVNGQHLPQDSAGADGVFGDDPLTIGVDESADDDLLTRGGSQVFSGFTPADEVDAHRTNIAGYADLEADLTTRLLADVAARFEHYSDFGSLVSGKLALRYQASPRLTLRAAVSNGFRAPGLGQINFSKVVTNVIGGVPTEVGIYPVGSLVADTLGAKPLKEEKSVNLSAGFAWSPASNVSFTADYFYVAITDRILLGATFDDSTTLAILASIGRSDIGGVQYFINGLNTRTQGADLTANWRTAAVGGNLEFTGAVNYTKNAITHIDPLPPVLANNNTTEPGIIDSVTYIAITDERPDWRGTLTAEWSRGRFRALGRGSYYGGFSSAQPGFCDLCRDNYGAKALFDAELGYRLGVLQFSLGARNLLNTYPDKPSSLTIVDSFNDTARDYNSNFGTFPWAAASPFGYNGRYVYARVSVPFSSR